MSEIVFADPPESTTHSRHGKLSRFIEALRARPGEWAIYRSDVPRSSQPQAWLKAKHPNNIETAMRSNGDEARTSTVYARWIEAPAKENER